jgi:hypothetical protein
MILYRFFGKLYDIIVYKKRYVQCLDQFAAAHSVFNHRQKVQNFEYFVLYRHLDFGIFGIFF